MSTKDIHGNTTGSKLHGSFHSRERRQVREVGNNKDIVGSHPGSLIRGIKVPEGQK